MNTTNVSNRTRKETTTKPAIEPTTELEPKTNLKRDLKLDLKTESKSESESESTPHNDSPQKRARDELAALRLAAKFHLGCVVATPAALALMERKAISSHTLVARHASGDWGDVGTDAKLNEMALVDGSRLFSVYRLVDETALADVPGSIRHTLPTIWIITNAANAAGVRDVTTLLTPKDY